MSMKAILPFLALALAKALAHPQFSPGVTQAQSPIGIAPEQDIRVPVLLGVMSRCSDALLCESVFDGVLEQTWGIVNVGLSFIGELDGADPTYGVTCKHGVQECRGNVQELCAMERANSQEDWWHFVQCLNFEGKDDVGDPVLAERCASVAYIPWEDETSSDGLTTRKGIKGCIEGPHGAKLLKASVKQSQALGITRSCTVMISGKTRCIRDGVWKECETGHTVEELVRFIKDEHQRLNSRDQGSVA